MPRKKKPVTARKRRQEQKAAGVQFSAGRPSAYLPEFDQVARVMCEAGATDFELGRAFAVTERTIINWRQTIPSFGAATQVAKDASDERVKRSLYQRAVGYDVHVEKVFNNQGEIIRAETVEHVPPDPQCIMKWLHNRKPEEWRERVEHKIVPPTAQELTDLELARRILFDLEVTERTKPAEIGQ